MLEFFRRVRGEVRSRGSLLLFFGVFFCWVYDETEGGEQMGNLGAAQTRAQTMLRDGCWCLFSRDALSIQRSAYLGSQCAYLQVEGGLGGSICIADVDDILVVDGTRGNVGVEGVHRRLQGLSVALDDDDHRLVGSDGGDDAVEVIQVGHELVVDVCDKVAGLDASLGGGTPHLDHLHGAGLVLDPLVLPDLDALRDDQTEERELGAALHSVCGVVVVDVQVVVVVLGVGLLAALLAHTLSNTACLVECQVVQVTGATLLGEQSAEAVDLAVRHLKLLAQITAPSSLGLGHLATDCVGLVCQSLQMLAAGVELHQSDLNAHNGDTF